MSRRDTTLQTDRRREVRPVTASMFGCWGILLVALIVGGLIYCVHTTYRHQCEPLGADVAHGNARDAGAAPWFHPC